MPIQKKLIINFCNTWLEILYPLKDAEFQVRSWFRCEGSEVSSFAEATAMLLDRYDMMIKPHYTMERVQLFDSEFFDLIKQLYEKVDAYTGNTDSIINACTEKTLLNDPKWLYIVSLAQKACDVLTRQIKSL